MHKATAKDKLPTAATANLEVDRYIAAGKNLQERKWHSSNVTDSRIIKQAYAAIPDLCRVEGQHQRTSQGPTTAVGSPAPAETRRTAYGGHRGLGYVAVRLISRFPPDLLDTSGEGMVEDSCCRCEGQQQVLAEADHNAYTAGLLLASFRHYPNAQTMRLRQ
jgi:hypothetical protein